jgi:hypothetical protein
MFIIMVDASPFHFNPTKPLSGSGFATVAVGWKQEEAFAGSATRGAE